MVRGNIRMACAIAGGHQRSDMKHERRLGCWAQQNRACIENSAHVSLSATEFEQRKVGRVCEHCVSEATGQQYLQEQESMLLSPAGC